MEKVLELLNQALQEGRAVITEFKTKLSHLESREAAHAENVEAFQKTSKDILAREAAITPIENFRKAEKDLEDKIMALSSQRAAFEDEKQKFKTHSDAVRQTNDNRAKDLDAQQKNVDAQQKKINDTIQAKYDEFVSKFRK